MSLWEKRNADKFLPAVLRSTHLISSSISHLQRCSIFPFVHRWCSNSIFSRLILNPALPILQAPSTLSFHLRLLGCSPRCSSMNVRKLVIFISGEVWQFFVGSEEIRFKLSSSSINFESFNKLVDSVVLQWLLSNPFEFAILIIVGSTWSSLNQQLMKLFLGDFHFPLSFFFFSTAFVQDYYVITLAMY